MKGMKIDHKGVKRLYEAHIAERTPQKRSACPSPELIFSLFQPNTSESIRNETLAHVLKCGPCTKEFQFILSSLREEEKFIKDIEEVLKPDKKDLRKKEVIKSFLFHFSWKYATFLVGAAIILAVILINLPNKHVYRGINYQSIKLISPLDQQHLKSNLTFHWEMVEDVEYFIFEIFDDSLYPIWKSEKTRENRIKPPSEVLVKLVPNKAYYWEVTAFLLNDRIRESRLQRFQVYR